jgi:hypothetical protein
MSYEFRTAFRGSHLAIFPDIGLNRFAQFADDDAQVMRVIEVRTTPNLLHDLLTRDHLAGVVRVQNQIFLRTEDESFAFPRNQ